MANLYLKRYSTSVSYINDSFVDVHCNSCSVRWTKTNQISFRRCRCRKNYYQRYIFCPDRNLINLSCNQWKVHRYHLMVGLYHFIPLLKSFIECFTPPPSLFFLSLLYLFCLALFPLSFHVLNYRTRKSNPIPDHSTGTWECQWGCYLNLLYSIVERVDHVTTWFGVGNGIPRHATVEIQTW